jgi:phosphatidylserine decarboxylase precursor
MSPTHFLKAGVLYCLPQHALSRLILYATRIRLPFWKNRLIDWFVSHYDVDLAEAELHDPHAYPNFNIFFTRALKAGARPWADAAHDVCSPVDGAVSQCGAIEGDSVFQAKGREISLIELLGGSKERAAQFTGGQFLTLYLSPHDYHRVHMPLTGKLLEMIHIPGRLFSVAPFATGIIPRLFARNERVVVLFDTQAGPMAQILVGALFVSCIEAVWAGVVTPPRGKAIRIWTYGGNTPIVLERGKEMGRFNMGSTVILLFPPGRVIWHPGVVAGTPVRLGQRLGGVLESSVSC